MKVMLKVPLSPMSGYGNDGIGLARALIRWGADVYLQPTSVQSPLPQSVADLFTKPLDPPFDLVINHVDPGMLEVEHDIHRVADMVVGWTMWEYSNFKNLPGRSTLKKRLKPFDAVLAYDEVTAQCFTEVTKKPVITLQGGYNPEQWEPIERDWHSERFGFCMVGVLSERKDPFVSIQAFKELKEEYPEEFEPAELHLKTVVPGLHSALEELYDKVRIHYAIWPEDVLREFYSKQHVLLSPSRGEGKNMPALEFQSTGGAVIATNWGGHKQWIHNGYAYPLDYTLQPVSPEFPETFNARASVDHLKELMLHTFRNRNEVKEKARLAQEIIPKIASWDSVVERMFHQLRQLDGGETLWQRAQSCHTDWSQSEHLD